MLPKNIDKIELKKKLEKLASDCFDIESSLPEDYSQSGILRKLLFIKVRSTINDCINYLITI